MKAVLIPQEEYPRPDFARSKWLNSNGIWDFCYDPKDMITSNEIIKKLRL